MITCKFVGGLGNHMYQVAATIQVAEQLNTDFVIPTFSHAGHYGDRPTDFGGFSYDFKKQDINLPNKFSQPTFGYTPVVVSDDMEMHGFFQAHQYFDNIRDKLIHTYYAFNDNVVKIASKYPISDNSLGISVRRGDYLMLQHNHCVLSSEYYQLALNLFPDVDQIYVFSDDYPWCKNVFGNDVTYVEEDKFVQLYLMTQMKHLILSNSTFAWWGAYLNNKKGTVIIPDPWFGPSNFHHDTKGLYCDGWTKVLHDIKLA